jgi:ABC-2 type transport system permease protein
VNASGGAAIWGQTRALIPGLLIGALWAVLFAAIGLVLASLPGRRAYATDRDRDTPSTVILLA